jgi:hypothetical protein
MDENRLFANETKYVTNMGALVKRDRNHPSVVIWSFCNEGGCESGYVRSSLRSAAQPLYTRFPIIFSYLCF